MNVKDSVEKLRYMKTVPTHDDVTDVEEFYIGELPGRSSLAKYPERPTKAIAYVHDRQ